jgi:hypothetical protein
VSAAIVPPAAIACIGPGTMGVPMAGHLAAKGDTVRGSDVAEAARGHTRHHGRRRGEGDRPCAAAARGHGRGRPLACGVGRDTPLAQAMAKRWAATALLGPRAGHTAIGKQLES